MEAAGSRSARANSRYGYSYHHHSSSSAAAFNGPVRRWEKKWVHVPSPSPSYPITTRQQRHHLQQKNFKIAKPGTGILLCKWTPLPPASSTSGEAGDKSSEKLKPPPSKRKFRYTPIAVLEEQKKKTARIDHEVESVGTDQSKEKTTFQTDDLYRMLNSYFPGHQIGVSEERKMEAANIVNDVVKSGEADRSNEKTTMKSDDIYGMLNLNPNLSGGNQAGNGGFLATNCSGRSTMNFNMFWKGHADNLDLDSLHKENLVDSMNQSGFWATG